LKPAGPMTLAGPSRICAGEITSDRYALASSLGAMRIRRRPLAVEGVVPVDLRVIALAHSPASQLLEQIAECDGLAGRQWPMMEILPLRSMIANLI